MKSSDYIFVNDILYHKGVPASKRAKTDKPEYQLVLPEALQLPFISFYHDSPLGGHAGISATIDRLKADFYFERMSVLVSEFIRTCHVCQSRKVTKNTKEPITAFNHQVGLSRFMKSIYTDLCPQLTEEIPTFLPQLVCSVNMNMVYR